MPRTARYLNASGYTHLITRGIGRQLLFEDAGDYRRYLSALEQYCAETGVRVAAWCLMDNHVHLLARGEPEQVILLMKKLGVSYSQYYNRKYGHAGHLFQDRYKSEPVNDEAYLLTVFRYILRNPEKAGICRASAYAWSSYSLYAEADPPAFADLSLLRERLGSAEEYAAFIAADNSDACMEYETAPHDDRWALSAIQDQLGVRSGTELQQLGKKQRDAALRKMKALGMSVRQIERLTGINRNIVQRA